MSDTTQTSGSTLMPGASAAPPLTIDPALVSLAQSAQTPPLTAASPIPVTPIGSQSAPAAAIPPVTPTDPLTVLANQAVAHVHRAPADRAALVLGTVQRALSDAVGLHTTGLAMATKAAASTVQSTASGLVADAESALGKVGAEVGALEMAVVAEVKKAAGITVPKWVFGLLVVGSGFAAGFVVHELWNYAATKL